MKRVTQNRLKELLDYNPETGVFTWKTTRGKCKMGQQSGYEGPRGYRRIMIDGSFYKASRLAFMIMEGYFPEYDCDHINRDKSDNRWKNLRHVSRQCNTRNSGRSVNNTSGVTGVWLNKRSGKWVADIKVDGRKNSLGTFVQFVNAVKARWEAEVKHGWPGCNSHTDSFCYLRDRVII